MQESLSGLTNSFLTSILKNETPGCVEWGDTNMSKLITASLDISKIDKSKIIEGKKGKYINLTLWVNDQEDQFGNNVSIQQSLSKEEREAGAEKIYLGNGKVRDGGGATPAPAANAGSNDLPF